MTLSMTNWAMREEYCVPDSALWSCQFYFWTHSFMYQSHALVWWHNTHLHCSGGREHSAETFSTMMLLPFHKLGKASVIFSSNGHETFTASAEASEGTAMPVVFAFPAGLPQVSGKWEMVPPWIQGKEHLSRGPCFTGVLHWSRDSAPSCTCWERQEGAGAARSGGHFSFPPCLSMELGGRWVKITSS